MWEIHKIDGHFEVGTGQSLNLERNMTTKIITYGAENAYRKGVAG
jgi:hypothetical protein